jgi:uncharacterized protein YfaS (alpha-2-macroglobulin family)
VEAGFDQKPPAEAVRDGLEVLRDLIDETGKPVTQLTTGQSATVRLRVRNISGRALTNIALLDLMPGGFEIEPDNLKPGPSALPGADYVDLREDRNTFFLTLPDANTRTFEYRIKPVCAGRFVIPPAFAEDMYDRATKARSTSSTVEVVPAP